VVELEETGALDIVPPLGLILNLFVHDSYDAATTVINIDSDDTNYWHTATGHGSYDAATTVINIDSDDTNNWHTATGYDATNASHATCQPGGITCPDA
jgi:hypothetical protein